MKTKIFLFIGTLTILTASWVNPKPARVNRVDFSEAVKSAPVNGFSFFRTHREGRFGVMSSWGVSSQQGITCFVLQRTYEFPDDYTTWENLCEMGCNNSRSYDFLDTNVFPGVISYRVVAMNGSIPVFVSPISAEQIRQR